jgi:hypothetical protein
MTKKKGRPTNEERIDKDLERVLKVSDLIKLLEKYPQDALVGRVGHFGELNGMDKYNLSLTKCYATPDGLWRNEYRRENIPIVDIGLIDIGPEPD